MRDGIDISEGQLSIQKLFNPSGRDGIEMRDVQPEQSKFNSPSGRDGIEVRKKQLFKSSLVRLLGRDGRVVRDGQWEHIMEVISDISVPSHMIHMTAERSCQTRSD